LRRDNLAEGLEPRELVPVMRRVRHAAVGHVDRPDAHACGDGGRSATLSAPAETEAICRDGGRSATTSSSSPGPAKIVALVSVIRGRHITEIRATIFTWPGRASHGPGGASHGPGEASTWPGRVGSRSGPRRVDRPPSTKGAADRRKFQLSRNTGSR